MQQDCEGLIMTHVLRHPRTDGSDRVLRGNAEAHRPAALFIIRVDALREAVVMHPGPVA
jgi:hypothetical protein